MTVMSHTQQDNQNNKINTLPQYKKQKLEKKKVKHLKLSIKIQTFETWNTHPSL